MLYKDIYSNIFGTYKIVLVSTLEVLAYPQPLRYFMTHLCVIYLLWKGSKLRVEIARYWRVVANDNPSIDGIAGNPSVC